MNLSSALILLNVLPAVVGNTWYENAVQEENDFAICGTDIQGCLSTSETAWYGYIKAILGPIDGIGSSKQKWNFENGLLKSTESNTNECLAPYIETFDQGTSYYKLVALKCPDNEDDFEATRHMRFTVADDRIVSLAHVRGGDAGSYCMTISSWHSTDYVKLTPCDEDTSNNRQSFEVIGNSEPFLYALDQNFGMQDTVELAYHAGTGTGQVSSAQINFYSADTADEPAYSHDVSQNKGGIITIDVSQYLDGESGSYIAKLESSISNISAKDETEAPFLVTGAANEPHDDDKKKDCPQGPWIIVSVGGLIFIAAVASLFLAIRHRCQNNVSAPLNDADAATYPPKKLDVDDDASEGTKESNESSKGSDAEMVAVDV